MKISIFLLTIVGLVSGSNISRQNVQTNDKKFLNIQKFLFEMVYRINEPLMTEEWIALGKTFTFDRAEYTRIPRYMEKYCKALKFGATLPKGEYFGALVKSHIKEAYGLFGFFYYAKSWELFQRNVAWARLYCNEGMFIFALNLVLKHRKDLQGLILPSIYEIFPQNFFNSKFIHAAKKFDYDMWSKYIMYEKKYKDILYEDYSTVYPKYDRHFYYKYTTDWKLWQWWKMMGLGEHWYSEENFIISDNRHSNYQDILKNTKMFFMPVDYSRDIDSNNKESVLFYFTEDVSLNAYWYYLNLNQALNGKNNQQHDQFWLHNLEQILRRYRMERLSHGFDEIPEFSFMDTSENSYNPYLISYNGIGYSYRENYYQIESFVNFDYYHKLLSMFNRLEKAIGKSVYETYDGETIDLDAPVITDYIGNSMQGKDDIADKYSFQYWYKYSNMYFGNSNADDYQHQPNAFLNYETMMRDPQFYIFHKKITNVFYQFRHNIKPYTNEELLFPGVSIKNVNVTKMVTYFDLNDFDVTNLMNDKVSFINGQIVWNKTLLARQMRLNHKPFEFEFTVESNKTQKVVVQTFLGPKYDKIGRVISLPKNRENFMEIDSFLHTLNSGRNEFKRNSNDFSWTAKDRISYTELYKLLQLALEGKYEFHKNISEKQCAFPDRLLLPRGWSNGMPMQLFFYISPFKAPQHYNSNYSYSCGIGSGVPYDDKIPFGYPLDREIIEYEFIVPNMLFKDVNIYHHDTFEKYFEHKYENFGKFDYNYKSIS